MAANDKTIEQRNAEVEKLKRDRDYYKTQFTQSMQKETVDKLQKTVDDLKA